jgi:hypothetical protein
LLLTFLQLSCKPDGGIGPCVHIYEEPILHIEWARNSSTGSYLRTIVLSDIMIDSTKQDPFWLVTESRNVAVLDSTLVCNPPCAFGTQPGRYLLRVSGNGVRDTVIVCDPSYKINNGGCPSSSNGGLRITIDLRSL